MKILSGLSEIEKAEIAFVLKLSHGFSDEKHSYMAMLMSANTMYKVSDLYGTGIRRGSISKIRGASEIRLIYQDLYMCSWKIRKIVK